MGNTLKIWKIGKYWERRTVIKRSTIFLFVFSLKRISLNFTGFIMLLHPFKICYKMNCIGALYKLKMKAASR